MVAVLSRSSAAPYMPDMPMHPSAMGNTAGPAAPSRRSTIGNLSAMRSPYEVAQPLTTARAHLSDHSETWRDSAEPDDPRLREVRTCLLSSRPRYRRFD